MLFFFTFLSFCLFELLSGSKNQNDHQKPLTRKKKREPLTPNFENLQLKVQVFFNFSAKSDLEVCYFYDFLVL